MLVCIPGLPGSGKTTLSNRLLALLTAPDRKPEANAANQPGVTYLHPGKHAWAMGLVQTQHATRAQLLSVPDLTSSFLTAIEEALDKGSAIVDGFPRTKEQAQELIKKAWEVIIVHLIFPKENEMAYSIARQEKRVQEDGVTVERKNSSQTTLALEHDQGAIDEFLSRNEHVITIDALLPAATIEAMVIRALDW